MSMKDFKIECYKVITHYTRSNDIDDPGYKTQEYLGNYSEHYSFEEALKAISDIRTQDIDKKFPNSGSEYNVYIIQNNTPLGAPASIITRYVVQHRMYNHSEHVIIAFDGAKKLEEFIKKVIQTQNLNISLGEPPKLKDTIEKVFRGELPTI